MLPIYMKSTDFLQRTGNDMDLHNLRKFAVFMYVLFFCILLVLSASYALMPIMPKIPAGV